MKKKLTPIVYLEIALGLTALVFALLWVKNQALPYESLGGLTAVLFVIIDIVRRNSLPDYEKEILQALSEVQALKQELGLKEEHGFVEDSEAVHRPEAPPELLPPPEPAPLGSGFILVLELRSELLDRLRDYAAARGREGANQSPRELAKLLPAQDVFGRGVNEFLDVAEDLAHAPEPLLDWAGKTGPGLIQAISS
jgi:hypothetical protein